MKKTITTKKQVQNNSSSAAEKCSAVLYKKVPPACLLAAYSDTTSCRRDPANSDLDNDANQANTGNRPSEKQDIMAVPLPAPLVSNATPLEEANLAATPGAFRIPGPTNTTILTNTVDPQHVMVEEEEEGRTSANTRTPVDIESDVQEQPMQTTIVSAYRVDDEEQQPAIIATPFKDNKLRVLIYGVLLTATVIALIVGLSVGLTTKGNEQQSSEPLEERLVSSINMTTDVGVSTKATRYSRTENGKEISTTTGSAVTNWCEVVPCIHGGCDLSYVYTKVYEPGCCRGDDCSPSDKCGYWCPERPDLCRPSYEGCKDASCFECERGPDGEVLYYYRDASFAVNCLKTGVATGYNDQNDKVERIYEWAIVCGYNIEGGNEWLNFGPGEYACIAVRNGKGITKSLTQTTPCQFIQLAECGCGPDHVQTGGLFPPPKKPCKTREDCRYLCSDAGEEEAKRLCDEFPGIEWWEGENILHQSLFYEPEELFFGNLGNLSIQIGIYGE